VHPGQRALETVEALGQRTVPHPSLQLERRPVRRRPFDRGHVPSPEHDVSLDAIPFVSSAQPVGYRVPTMPTLARLSVTPVKGTLIHHPERVTLTEAGIPGNRLFYLVDERGELFSGPDHGPLVRIRASYDPSLERLTLLMPDGAEVDGAADRLGDRAVTNFYGRPVAAHVVQGPFAEACSAFSSRPVRLLRCDRDGDGADVEPVTIVSFASVRDLARRGRHEGPLDARRFRLNLELEGCEPYEEDTWEGRRLRIGEATIAVGGQVPRCVFTTKDPDTGVKDWDTLTQIAKFRPRIAGDGGLPFGMYARVVEPGPVTVGDEVTALPEIG
jgi:uncharacterized protein